MTITLITQEEYLMLCEIQTKHPNLTYQNKGYDTVDKTKFSEEDHKAFKKVSELLEKSIKGFTRFDNFKILSSGDVAIRFHYNYCADDDLNNKGGSTMGYFDGVGYLYMDELVNGFDEKPLTRLRG